MNKLWIAFVALFAIAAIGCDPDKKADEPNSTTQGTGTEPSSTEAPVVDQPATEGTASEGSAEGSTTEGTTDVSESTTAETIHCESCDMDMPAEGSQMVDGKLLCSHCVPEESKS